MELPAHCTQHGPQERSPDPRQPLRAGHRARKQMQGWQRHLPRDRRNKACSPCEPMPIIRVEQSPEDGTPEPMRTCLLSPLEPAAPSLSVSKLIAILPQTPAQLAPSPGGWRATLITLMACNQA